MMTENVAQSKKLNFFSRLLRRATAGEPECSHRDVEYKKHQHRTNSVVEGWNSKLISII